MKKISLVLIGIFMLSSLVACGKQSTKNASKSAQKSGSELIKLRMIVLESRQSDLAEILEDYHHTLSNVEVELVTVPDFPTLSQNVLAAYQAGDAYDITTVNHVDTLAYVKGKILLPLDSYIKEDNINYQDIIYPSLLESGKVDAIQYTIPINTDTRVLAVNKELFKKYNLEYPNTLQDMLSVGAMMTKGGDFGFVNSMTRNDYVSTYEQGVFLKSIGGSLYELKDGVAVASIDTPEMRKYLNFNLELLQYMPKDSLTMTEDDGRKAFLSGNVGMYIFGPWEFKYLKENLATNTPFTIDLIKIPAGEAGANSTSGGFQLAICSGTKQAEAAWDLLKFITTSEVQLARMAHSGLPTSEKAFLHAPFTNAKYQIFKEQLASSYLPQPPVPNLGKVVSEFSAYWSDLLFGKIAVDEMTIQAQKSVQEVLDENN